MKIIKQLIFPALFIFFLILNFNFASADFKFDASTGLNTTAGGADYKVGGTVGTKSDIAARIGKVASVAISFVGVIFLVLILMGSFELTSSAGNDQKVESGKNKIKNGAIGILIVFASYLLAKAITAFVTGAGEGSFKIFNT